MKQFLILGTNQVCHYTIMFELLKEGKVNTGGFRTHTLLSIPDGTQKDIGMTIWYTTLDIYDKDEYQPIDIEPGRKYDNYDAVDATSTTIPKDYNGNIGVPVTYICKPHHQYELVDRLNPIIDGKHIYKRLIIRKRQ